VHRVDRASVVIVGIGFGAAAPPPFRDYALSVRAKWAPVIEAARAAMLDLDALSPQDRTTWETGAVPFTVDLLGAIVAWPPVEPEDLRCRRRGWSVRVMKTPCAA
jgi:hypothetical protein